MDLGIYDSLILFISSHGTNSQVLDSNSQPVSIGKIQAQRNSENSPALSAKPQLFFVDSCPLATTNTNINNEYSNSNSRDDMNRKNIDLFLYLYHQCQEFASKIH